MNILAADTSLSSASVAILCDEVLQGEIVINQNKTHSEKFMPALESLLIKLDIKLDKIDLYACGIGPGSFTGLRIGVTTLKTLAYVQKKPIIGINSLDALAFGAGFENQIVCPLINARNEQVYTALYRIKKVDEYPDVYESHKGILLVDFLKQIQNKYKEKIIFTGDCTNKFKEIIIRFIGDNAVFIPNVFEYSRASSIAYLANIKYKLGILDNTKTLEPFYLRPSQAERMLETKNE
jgi:tRNA threonylcarbamoyladenosine biosynthesis protein TsaB